MNAVVDPDGRIVVSFELARELGLKPGDAWRFENRGGEWIFSIVGTAGLCYVNGILVHRGVCTESIEDAVEKDREERMNELSKGIPYTKENP